MSLKIKALIILLALSILVGGGETIRRWRMAGNSGALSNRLVIFHAGSLALPFKEICEAFEKKHPGVEVFREIAGSRECARKITDLHKPCDVMASADYAVIDTLLIPDYADWNIRFAGNEMIIAFRKDSRGADRINKNNWYEVLMRDDVVFGRSAPNLDPAGYRTVLLTKLAEIFYAEPNLSENLLSKNLKYIYPMSAELLALLEVGELDYIFTYRSVAEQHNLHYITLPDEINLSRPDLSEFYRRASVRLVGRERGNFITRVGEPIVYGVTIPKNAPNPELARAFLSLLLDKNRGLEMLQQNGQNPLVPSPTETFEKLPESLKKYALPTIKEDGE